MSFLFSPIGESVSSRIQTESGRKETAKEGKETVLRPILKSIVRTRFFFVLPSSSCSHKRLYYTFTVRVLSSTCFHRSSINGGRSTPSGSIDDRPAALFLFTEQHT